jgi:PEP-CTERM motif
MRKIEGIVEWLFLRGSPLSSSLRIALLVACVPVLLALPFIGHVTERHTASQRASSRATEVRESLLPSRSDSGLPLRTLYPYSVIPGGAYSEQELRNAVERDPVVAHHYADFDLAKVRVIRLDSDRMEYVSYRLGDRIFWTNRQLRLRKGEELITDGTHLARTRCGNRLSDHADAPTSAAQPSAEALNSPVPEVARPDLFAGNYLPQEFPQLGAPLIPSGGGSSGGPTGTIIPPIYYPIVGGGPPGSSSPGGPTGGGPPGGGPPGGGPPVNTPEPSSLLLLAGGLGSLWALARRRNLRS